MSQCGTRGGTKTQYLVGYVPVLNVYIVLTNGSCDGSRGGDLSVPSDPTKLTILPLWILSESLLLCRARRGHFDGLVHRKWDAKEGREDQASGLLFVLGGGCDGRVGWAAVHGTAIDEFVATVKHLAGSPTVSDEFVQPRHETEKAEYAAGCANWPTTPARAKEEEWVAMGVDPSKRP